MLEAAVKMRREEQAAAKAAATGDGLVDASVPAAGAGAAVAPKPALFTKSGDLTVECVSWCAVGVRRGAPVCRCAV